jgi:hypothetical protein
VEAADANQRLRRLLSMHGASFGLGIFAYLLILCTPTPAIIAFILVPPGRRLLVFVAAVGLSDVLSGAGMFGFLYLDAYGALPSWMAGYGLAVVLAGPVILSALIARWLVRFFKPLGDRAVLHYKRK